MKIVLARSFGNVCLMSIRGCITASSFIITSTIAVRRSPFSFAGFVTSIPSVLTFDLLWVWPPFFFGFVITVSLRVESNINFELCIVDMLVVASAIVQENDETLQGVQAVIYD